METIVYEIRAEQPPGWLVELADDMVEDPRCHAVVLGSGSTEVMLFSLWDEESAAEVEEGLRRLGRAGTVRRMSVADGHAVWG